MKAWIKKHWPNQIKIVVTKTKKPLKLLNLTDFGPKFDSFYVTLIIG